MEQLETIQNFIDNNIFQSELWDTLTDPLKQKLINNASIILKSHLPQLFENEIPTHDLVDQMLWILKQDDTMQRAEMGVTSLSVEGMSVSFDGKDRPIAPSIVARYNLETNGRRRRAVPYSVSRQDTSRAGIQNVPFSKSGRWY